MFRFTFLVFVGLWLVVSGPVSAEVAVSDQGVSISEQELENIISNWTPQMRRSAADDMGDRIELLNASLTSRKMAAEMDAMTPEEFGARYWKYQAKLRDFKRQHRLELFLDTLEIPDMEDLAKERYQTSKEKYARVPEKRLSSHILFKCLAGTPDCDRTPLRPKVAALLEELRAGASFEDMVQKYSDDRGTKAKKGLFDRWMQLGELGVEPTYSGGVFSIAEVGEYAEVVESRFGLHIIRLDGIEPKHFLAYEKVKDKIIADLTTEFRQLALKDFYASYQISDEGYINGDALDKLLAPYKSSN